MYDQTNKEKQRIRILFHFENEVGFHEPKIPWFYFLYIFGMT